MLLYEHIQEATEYLQNRTGFAPRVGIILGTGLGELVEDIDLVAEVPYGEIPHFPESTAPSHKSKLVFGRLEGTPVVAMAGRFHYYEGYSMQQVTFPVRVMKFLGVEQLIVSNVAGSTNQHIHAGDIVFLKDHINLQPANPLRGENDERLGPRFPDMKKTYDQELLKLARQVAQELNIPVHEGVYACLPGPNLETPAEYVFLHRIGADLVGMSTVPEIIVAKHMDLSVFALSVVSNQSYPPEVIEETTVEEVIALAKATAPKMRAIVKGMVKQLD